MILGRWQAGLTLPEEFCKHIILFSTILKQILILKQDKNPTERVLESKSYLFTFLLSNHFFKIGINMDTTANTIIVC